MYITLFMVHFYLLLQVCHWTPWGEAYVSCSVVLPAFCHLQNMMRVSDEDPLCGKVQDFLQQRSCRTSSWHEWWILASALDQRFKDLKCLSRGEREQVWSSLEKYYKKEDSAQILHNPVRNMSQLRRRESSCWVQTRIQRKKITIAMLYIVTELSPVLQWMSVL